jgi:UDP-N-acetylglucosamine:LPS N-acetylglucosamine transferase
MVAPAAQTQRVEVIQHPTLIHFNAEFGTDSDLSRYENIRTQTRAISPEVVYLNQLQMGSYITSTRALLLKNNLHDIPFVTFTTRSILYELKQAGKISEGCFNFLHNKVNAREFVTVFKYLYIFMLYTQIAKKHDDRVTDPIFRFQSPSQYSDQLVKSPIHVIEKELNSLQQQYRIQFMREWLTQIGSRANCPGEAQREIFPAIAAMDSQNFTQFRIHFLTLLEKLQSTSELEKICWQEFQSTLIPFTSGNDFFEQAYLRLRTESYYKNCLSRVTTLRQSLEQTDNAGMLAVSEQCKKAYNGCIYLLQDSKNMPACSSMRFSALTGKMRTEWQAINNVFNRVQQQHAHRLCACQVQAPASQNEMAEWPFRSHTLISLKPAQPATTAQLQARGVDMPSYQQNQTKTVAVIGCKWGGGHMEVSRGIANNLTSLGYHAVSIDLPEILIGEDFVQNLFITRWLGKDWSTATLFEGLLKSKAFACINFLRWAQSKFFNSTGYTESSLKLVLEHLLKTNPDSVVTTYSAHNEVIIKACQILGIPCMHVATDINNEIETRNTPPDYQHFKMAIPFNATECINPILNTTTAEQRVVCGPPVRHDFTLQRSEQDILRMKQAWGIDLNKKVVVISNGKAGAHSPLPEILARKYANSRPEDVPIHLVVLCGKDNVQFKRYLEQNVATRTRLPMTVELFTEKMEELISMASYGGVVVGKGGGGTIFESFSRGARILIDNVRPSWLSQGFAHFVVTTIEMMLRWFGFKGQLPWEKVNMEFAKRNGLADVFKDERDFLPKLEQMLNNNNRPVPLNIEVKNVENEIPRVLREMLVKAQVHLDTQRAREIHRNL